MIDDEPRAETEADDGADEEDVPPDPEKFNWKPGDVVVDHLEVPKTPKRERDDEEEGRDS